MMITTGQYTANDPVLGDTLGMDDRAPAGTQGGSPFLPPGMDMEEYRNLIRVMDKNYRGMAEFRKEAQEIRKEQAGNRWNGKGTKGSRPVNMIAIGLATYKQRLAGSIPSVLITAQNSELTPLANDLQIDVNRDLKVLELDELFEDGVAEGLIGISVAKVYWKVEEFSQEQDPQTGQVFDHERGVPCVDLVDCEDVYFDLNAKRQSKMRYVGNRWTMPWSEFESSPMFSDEAKEQMKSFRHASPRPQVWEERPNGVANPEEEDQVIEDEIALRDVYLPPRSDRPAWFMTIADKGDDSPPLRGHPWFGAPTIKPFYVLAFDTVSGSALPFPPARHWVDLQKAVSNLYAKLISQARRQKTVLPVPTTDAADVEKLNSSGDGKAFKITGTGALRETSFGGPNQTNLAFAIHAKQLISYVMGNIELLAGLASNEPTLGQTEIMAQGSKGSLGAMERKARKWMRDICRAVAFYRYHDPHYNTKIPVFGPDGNVMFESPFSYDDTEWQGMMVPGRRQADFFNFQFEIAAYSAEPRTPQQKIDAMITLLTTIFERFGMQARTQGVSLDVKALVSELSKLLNMEPEMRQLVINASIPEAEPNNQKDGAITKPSVTTRNYNRTSSGARGTQQGHEMNLMNTLLGDSGVPKEAMMAG